MAISRRRRQQAERAGGSSLFPALSRDPLLRDRIDRGGCLFRHDGEVVQNMGPEGMDERDVGGIAAAGEHDAPYARRVVACVHREPPAAGKDLHPRAEIHGGGIGRHADIAQIAVDVAGGDIERPAQSDGDMCKVAADADALGQRFLRGASWPRKVVAEGDVAVHVIDNGAHSTRIVRQMPEKLPRHSAKTVGSQYRLARR